LLSYLVGRNAFVFSNPITNGSGLDSQIFRSFVNVYPFIVSDIRHLYTSGYYKVQKTILIIADLDAVFNMFPVILMCFMLFKSLAFGK